jgi:hypothetical protein
VTPAPRRGCCRSLGEAGSVWPGREGRFSSPLPGARKHADPEQLLKWLLQRKMAQTREPSIGQLALNP